MLDTVILSPTAPLSLDDLLASSLVPRYAWDRLPSRLRRRLREKTAASELLPVLVEHRLLTPCQSRRLALGERFGLLLGDYRVLDRVGSGTMAVVFRGEH